MGITDFLKADEVQTPQEAPMERYISVAQACEMLSVSDETLRRWEKQGKIQSYRLPSPPDPTSARTRVVDYRGKRYKLSDVQALVQPNEPVNENI